MNIVSVLRWVHFAVRVQPVRDLLLLAYASTLHPSCQPTNPHNPHNPPPPPHPPRTPHPQMDPNGWIAERLEWWTLWLLCADDSGMISKEKIRGQVGADDCADEEIAGWGVGTWGGGGRGCDKQCAGVGREWGVVGVFDMPVCKTPQHHHSPVPLCHHNNTPHHPSHPPLHPPTPLTPLIHPPHPRHPVRSTTAPCGTSWRMRTRSARPPARRRCAASGSRCIITCLACLGAGCFQWCLGGVCGGWVDRGRHETEL